MAKFKRGDKVVMVSSNSNIPKNTIGIVNEDDSNCPFVIWNLSKTQPYYVWAESEENLELYQSNTPSYDIY